MVQIIRDGFLVPLNERPSLGRSKLVQRIISSSWFRGLGCSGGGLSGLSEGGLGCLGFIQRYRQCRRLSQWSLGGLGGLGGLRGCSSCSRVQVLEVRAEVLGAHRRSARQSSVFWAAGSRAPSSVQRHRQFNRQFQRVSPSALSGLGGLGVSAVLGSQGVRSGGLGGFMAASVSVVLGFSGAFHVGGLVPQGLGGFSAD